MRVASLSPAATEILFAIGKGTEIVCRDQFSDFPEEARRIAKVMGHQSVDIDDVKKFKPDLALTGTVIQEALAAELRAKGVHVVHQDPRSVHAIKEAIMALGVLFDAEQAAKETVRRMEQELSALQKKARLLPRVPRVYVEEWHNPPMASGNWVPELVRMAGGKAFPIPDGELSRAVTLEEVKRFDPDLIVISWCGAGVLADKNLLTKRAGWSDLRAVVAGQVRVIDDSLFNRPGPRVTEGVQRLYGWMFELLH